MASARNIAGSIAKLLGRPESEGWVFTKLFQDAGLFLKGHGGRGGTGAPAADTREAVLLLLAMASGAGPKQAVADAVAFYLLPFAEGRDWRLTASSESWATVENVAGTVPHYFGDALAGSVDFYRAGMRLPCPLFSGVRFGVAGNIQYGEAITNRLNAAGETADVLRGFCYSRVFDVAMPPHPIERGATIPGAILDELAALLGPLRVDGGGSVELGEDETEQDEADELIAAAPAVPPQSIGSA